MSSAMQRSKHVSTEAARPGFAEKRAALLLYAFLAALAVLCWQAATVHFNYGGNWTALFMTGDLHPAPPELSAGTYRFSGSTGYDGQFYRYVANAPWVRTDWLRYFDSPRLRYARILVPASAWLAAAGQSAFVDAAYIGVVLFWILLGVYWLERYAVLEGHHPSWGLAFLLLPATLTSIDRMTADVALAALCVAFVLYSKERSSAGLYLVLLLAPLVRETGVLLLAAQCAHEAAAIRWRRAAVFATAILPAAAWYAYVWYRVAAAAVAHPENHTQLLPQWLFRYPVVGIFMELFRPTHYPFSPWLSLAVQCADALALCGCLALMTAAVLDLHRRPWDVEQWAILAFLTLVLATSAPGFWSNVYGYARPFSTLMFLATLRLLRRRVAWALAPLLLIALRVGIQIAPQAARIMSGLL